MPQAFLAIGGWLGATTTVGAFLISNAVLLGNLVMLAGAMAISNRQKKKAKEQARAQYNASQVDRLANIPTAVGVRELVLGRVRKGGVPVFRESTGTDKQYFVVVIALAGHEIDGVEEFYLNDVKVTVASNGNVETGPYHQVTKEIRSTSSLGPGTPAYLPGDEAILVPGSTWTTTTYAYDGQDTTNLYYQVYRQHYYANLRVYNGTDTQTADARLMSLFPGVWTANHRLQGIAYLICEFRYNETAFPSGVPSATVVMRGAKCYDPRTDSTVWTDNPALQIRHVLTHPNFGKRSTVRADEDLRIVAAANACDAPYTTPGAGGTTGPLYQGACVFPFGTPAVDVFDDLAQAACGMWAYAGGSFFFKAGAYTAPVYAFDGSDLATSSGSDKFPITVLPHKARADQVNVVIPKIWDADQDFKEVALLPRKNELAIAADGLELPQEIPMMAVPKASRAYVIANFILKESRDPLMVTANFKMVAYPIELFDPISLTLPRFGWDAKEFTVLGKVTDPTGHVKLSLKETSAELYDPLAVADSDGFASNSDLVNPWDVDPPGELTLTSGTDELVRLGDGTVISRVRVQWPSPTDYRIAQGGFFELVWYYTADGGSNFISAPAADSSLYIVGVQDGSTIVVSARYRTPLAVTDWTLLQTHLVVGKTEAPDPVSSAQVTLELNTAVLSWSEVTNADLAGYEVRTTDSGWGLDTDYVFKGNALNCRVEKTASTWYIRTFDTSNNYSLTSTSASYTFLPIPNVTGITHFFTDTSLTAATITLSWVPPETQFPISGFEVTYGSEVFKLDSTTITLPANWLGLRNFTVKTVDVFGDTSTGALYGVNKLAPNPPLNFRAQVIDNEVLFYWNLPVKTSLPVSHVVLRRGATWETAFVYGAKSGTFTTVSELAGGDYTYWLAVVDTDNNFSTPVELVVRVSQPPDFLFNSEFISEFFGAESVYSNAKYTDGAVLLPVNLTETLGERFTANSWSHLQDQITAGFPYFMQPGLSPGYYEETFDLGTILGSSSIAVTSVVSAIVGVVAVTTNISVSIDDSTYVEFGVASAVFAQNFRYIKVRVTVTQTSAGALALLSNLNVRLDTKLKTESGVIDALSTDTDGTIYNFNSEFVDVTTISPGVVAAVPRLVTYAFLDAVLSGTYTLVSDVLTVNIVDHQLIVGQRVRLTPQSGDLEIGLYTVATVPTADSFTVNLVADDTSGNLSSYPNSARIYVFDKDGVRQSNTVSLTIRGS